MLNRESLASPADQLIFGQLFEAAFAIYESAYYARQKGILDESEWSRFDAAVCRNMRNGAIIWEPNSSVVLGQGVRGTLTGTFANYVEEHCDWASIKAGLRSGTEPNE
ncbi:MAG: hypothetical protein GXP15_13440 [Gammaproteobacteria bacterium]|nr:hypothetical protein [Gammaproteobacteria bacterium]